MLRYINSLATIERNCKSSATEIHFKGYGTPREYAATLDMALEFALLQQTSNYLIKKDHFEDIAPKAFYDDLHQWLQRLNQYFERGRRAKSRVALLVPKASFLALSSAIHTANASLSDSFYHVSIELFYAADKALQHLQRTSHHTSTSRPALATKYYLTFNNPL